MINIAEEAMDILKLFDLTAGLLFGVEACSRGGASVL